MGCSSSSSSATADVKQPTSPRHRAPHHHPRIRGDSNMSSVSLPVTSAQHVNQNRLSMAIELVNSGRPISVSIAEHDDDDDDKSHKDDNDELKKTDEQWTGQLNLIRQFYDWEEIPLDFFVDQQVSTGNVWNQHNNPVIKPKRRISLQIVELTQAEAKEKPRPGEVFVQQRGSEML